MSVKLWQTLMAMFNSLMTPMNISFWWNIGSMLLIMFMVQISSGVLITFYYVQEDFYSNISTHLESMSGDFFQLTHANFPSLIFFTLYLHMFKAILTGSFLKMKSVWTTGYSMLIMIMAISFLGYVLPWGQMSLWGATVIINLLSVMPGGEVMVMWVWGGYFVSGITLKVFYTYHFLLPFILMLMIFWHLMTLHFKGSSNFLGVDLNLNKIEFIPNFLYKDLFNITVIVWMICWIMQNSFKLLDTENFMAANLMISPVHIKPEWYFLQFYAILRAIPNKMGGVILFFIALVSFLLIVSLKSYSNTTLKSWKTWCYTMFTLSMLLIWLGGSPVEMPYLQLSQVLTSLYFMWFIILMFMFG